MYNSVFFTDTLKSIRNYIVNIEQTIKKCLKKGVKICFGTDAGTPGNYHGQQTREFALMVEAGLPPIYVLQAATIRNASLLRMENEIGSIKEGKLADIVAFKDDPTKDMEVMNHACFVMKDGKVYKKQRI